VLIITYQRSDKFIFCVFLIS